MKVLILSAFAEEMQSLKLLLGDQYRTSGNPCIDIVTVEHQAYKHHDLYFAYTGIGTVAAGIVIGMLNQALKPDLVIFIGTAGGIAKHLRIGDIVVANEVVDLDIYNMHDYVKGTPFESALINPYKNKSIPKHYPTGNAFNLSKRLSKKQSVGRLASSNHFPTPAFMFDTLQSLNILSIDMESSAIYQAAWLLNIDALVVRCISNLIDDLGHDPDIKDAKISLCADNLANYTIELLNVL